MKYISGRWTPWDEKAFQKKTYELLQLDLSNKKELKKELLNETYLGAGLIYGRFAADDYDTKALLIEAGFIPCETSYDICLPRLDKYIIPNLYSLKKYPLTIEGEDSFEEISAIASDRMFHFSRFHEDPKIPSELADKRLGLWVCDLKNQDNIISITYRNLNGVIISFMICQKDNETVRFLLGGSRKGMELHSPFFWGSVISYWQEKGMKKITTTISAANIGVVNIYSNLGFVFNNVKIDYHKHIDV
ncbi:hypothetical protein [Aeromonas piscicola]|uniref:hypothetical protein n=1 Tax=Aeromonas piscicola TaxID=600645 RepID=UPI0028E96977|nr:hypothetical protein [Aeromonas piscicola]